MIGSGTSITGTTWLDVIIAIIGLLSVVAAAFIPAVLVALHSRRQKAHNTIVEEAIGTPNGQGNVVQMLEGLTNRADSIDARVSRLERRGWRYRVACALAPVATEDHERPDAHPARH